MADETIQEDLEQELVKNTDRFKAVAEAYGFVRGEEEVRALASRTFGAILQSRIDEIRGADGSDSKLNELDRIKAAFDQVIRELEEEEEKRDA